MQKSRETKSSLQSNENPQNSSNLFHEFHKFLNICIPLLCHVARVFSYFWYCCCTKVASFVLCFLIFANTHMHILPQLHIYTHTHTHTTQPNHLPTNIHSRTEEDLKRLQQETSGGNYSQVDFHYDGQSTCSSSGADNATSPTSESSTLTEESELPYTLPPTLLVPPAPGMQLVS